MEGIDSGQEISETLARKSNELTEEEQNALALQNLDPLEKLKQISRKAKASNSFIKLDAQRIGISERLDEQLKNAPKSLLERAEEKKTGVERRLEDSKKELDELLNFGDELVTNIQVANEKREILRRNMETSYLDVLKERLQAENAESLAHFDCIADKWTELETYKEPIALFEGLNKQKESFAVLMERKDQIILECQKEVDRINEKYRLDQEKQANDVCSLVERVDTQIELIKKAYKSHLDLLHDTIEDERQNIKISASNKWNELYQTVVQNEKTKFELLKEKQRYYANEIQRISTEQEEITRSTRLRLEKDAEMLEWEMINTKNSILMNSEKLDYNYQVLQKRNEENVIINNQQKRRVARLNEIISGLKKKIQHSIVTSEATQRKLSADIQKLHANISELENKSQQFRKNNKKKFDGVWEINYEEVKQLLTKVFEIDRIMYEQQLIKSWTPPDIDMAQVDEDSSRFASTRKNMTQKAAPFLKKPRTFMKDDPIQKRFMRNVLRRIADRCEFLVESKLLKILEPYTDSEQCIVRIDNIFHALRVTDMNMVAHLCKQFEPYSWCANCSPTIDPEYLKNIYALRNETNPIYGQQYIEKHKEKEPVKCDNHELVTEPALVLAVLNQFTMQKTSMQEAARMTDYGDVIFSINIPDDDIKNFWKQFLGFIPEQKINVWKALEHALHHYLEVLKKREALDKECMFLRRQNVELHHLLRRFVV